MISSEQLGEYLTDHLGGAAVGVDMARKLRADARDSAEEELFGTLAEEIEADRKLLEDFIGVLGAERGAVKQAVGWMAEKASRLVINEYLVGSHDLRRLLECEALALGISGKLAMWEALQSSCSEDSRVAALDLATLIVRAKDQFLRVEKHRLAAAKKAFAGQATAGG
ncbi:MAG: hypothetical protein ACR2GH_04865 [Pseudonocardia sp.]